MPCHAMYCVFVGALLFLCTPRTFEAKMGTPLQWKKANFELEVAE